MYSTETVWHCRISQWIFFGWKIPNTWDTRDNYLQQIFKTYFKKPYMNYRKIENPSQMSKIDWWQPNFMLKIYCDTVPFKFHKFGSKKSRSACFHNTVPIRSNFSQSQKNKFKMPIGCPPPCGWRAKYNWRKAPGQSTQFLHSTLKPEFPVKLQVSGWPHCQGWLGNDCH